jgi:hypothetical protein
VTGERRSDADELGFVRFDVVQKDACYPLRRILVMKENGMMAKNTVTNGKRYPWKKDNYVVMVTS